MSELLFKHFEVARNYTLKNVEKMEEAVIDVQPEGFNNTIHWHIGHVLTVTEQFMFGFPQKSSHLPANYLELFGNGTKPADWQGEIPAVDVLIAQLKEQLDRIKQIPAESFAAKLKTPFLGQETFGELANFSAFHETLHLGQMTAMRRVINSTLVK
jgi:uncharacterized damage-inducible protein DinB